jgi:hypothetical protein
VQHSLASDFFFVSAFFGLSSGRVITTWSLTFIANVGADIEAKNATKATTANNFFIIFIFFDY